MSTQFDNIDGTFFIRPGGAMTAVTAPAQQEEILTRIDSSAESAERLVLDLANVPFVSSHGLRVVIHIARRAPTGTKLVVCGMSDQIEQIFLLSGLDRLVDICLLYTSPSPRDQRGSRMPSSA